MKGSILAAVMVAMLLASALPSATSAPVGIPILIDLSHKQPPAGVEFIIRIVPEGQWYVLVKTQEDADALPPLIKANAHGILVGDFSTVDLDKLGIVMVIIGQPQAPLAPAEVAAIAGWFTGNPGRALWLAADSDYPAQGSELSQHAANMVLETIGAQLRMDYVSIEDSVSNAGAGYRVVATTANCEVPVLKFAAEKVLFHGPGAVSWVDEAGTWHPVKEGEKPDNVYIIATTTENGLVVEHQAEPKGTTGKAYTPGSEGVFTLMAAEEMSVAGGTNIVIVSGETPYGGYQPGVSWLYYGVHLDGPRFARNVILWATHYMGELKEIESIAKLPGEITATLEEKSGQLEARVNSAISGVSAYLNAALGLAALALILSIVAIALGLRKPKT